jgi:6-phosphogluconolactonase
MTAPQWPKLPGAIEVLEVKASELNQVFARDIAARLGKAITERGHAVLCVSGGKSPIALFEALREQDLPWQQVTITLADERCVPCTHPDSNALLVQTHLLQGKAAKAKLILMVPNTDAPLPTPVEIAKQAGTEIQAAGRADVLVLGMGSDGHTASLFPEAPNLAAALDRNTRAPCLAIELAQPPANAPYPRITQTLAQLLSARHIVLPVSGEEKINTLQKAWPEASAKYPVSFVLHQDQTPLTVWIST